ncbi:Uncharacterised protein [Mycobacteroides abscessus subsp. abscessus]|nr:Uncharacterised protein [Mycobacteroides abscessus subsp. abscessus]
MLTALEKGYKSKVDKVNEEKLFAILEVQRQPVKWTVTTDGKIVDIYPHPKLNKANKVIGVEYKTYKAINIPEELYDAYYTLVDDIDKKVAKAQRNIKGKYEKMPDEMKAQAKSLMYLWLGQYESGATYTEIDKKANFSELTIHKYIKLAKAELTSKEVI